MQPKTFCGETGNVREQVEEEATAQGIVDKLKKAGDTGLLFIDAQLAKR